MNTNDYAALEARIAALELVREKLIPHTLGFYGRLIVLEALALAIAKRSDDYELANAMSIYLEASKEHYGPDGAEPAPGMVASLIEHEKRMKMFLPATHTRN